MNTDIQPLLNDMVLTRAPWILFGLGVILILNSGVEIINNNVPGFLLLISAWQILPSVRSKIESMTMSILSIQNLAKRAASPQTTWHTASISISIGWLTCRPPLRQSVYDFHDGLNFHLEICGGWLTGRRALIRRHQTDR
jgi:hypothetical protein